MGSLTDMHAEREWEGGCPQVGRWRIGLSQTYTLRESER